MRFINRQKELQRLDKFAASSEGGLAVIWGRRRTGKTRLLLEWAESIKGFTIQPMSLRQRCKESIFL